MPFASSCPPSGGPGAAAEAAASAPAPAPASLSGDSCSGGSSTCWSHSWASASAPRLAAVGGRTPCHSSVVGGGAFSLLGSSRRSRPAPLAKAPCRSCRFSCSSCRSLSRLWSSSSRREASLCKSSSSHSASSRIAACCSEATLPSTDLCQVHRFSLVIIFRASKDFWRLLQYRSCSSAKRPRTCCQCFRRPCRSSAIVAMLLCRGCATATSRSPASWRSAPLNAPKLSRKLKQASAQSKVSFPNDLPGSALGNFSLAWLQTPCSSVLNERQFVTI
mmetsp:Transcript_90253/g.264000  ORF Transcript_90253/g.264000 Transcript_90253/m.264000 type:complete len:276 (-) Transcript_90253:155-982(-)